MSASVPGTRPNPLIGLVLFGFFACYVLSSTYFFWTSSVLYYAKHASLILLGAVGSIAWLRAGKASARGRYVLFVAAVWALALPYLMRFALRGDLVEFFVFVEYALFAIAVVVIASTAEAAGPFIAHRTFLLIVGSVACVALAAAVWAPGQLYNSYWGRPRLLLGFWHPKQIGALIAPAALIAATRAIWRTRPVLNWSAYLFLVVVLLFVDSRNMFLFSVLSVGGYLCATYLSYYALWAFIGTGVGLIAWVVHRYPLLADVATSSRLTVWANGSYTLFGRGTRLDQVMESPLAKFHIDNYYLEYVIENGIYAVVLGLVLVGVTAYVLRFTGDRKWRRLKLSVALAFFFTSIFDAGMFSTGSLLNVVVWVYLLSAEFMFTAGGTPRDVEQRFVGVPPRRSRRWAGDEHRIF
jgi:hypothetical protein